MDPRIAQLIDAIYAAAESPDRWASYLTLLREATGAHTASFLAADFTDQTISVSVTEGNGAEVVADYHAHWASRDIWFQSGSPLLKTPGAVYPSQALVPDQVALQSAIYNECYRQVGIFHGACATVEASAEFMVLQSCNFSLRQGPAKPEILALFTQLVPHLQRAARIHRTIAAASAGARAYDSLVDRAPVGCLLLDQHGRVVRLNQRAERIVQAADGLTVRGARLCCGDGASDARLQAAIRSTVRLSGGGNGQAHPGFLVRRPSGAEAYEVSVSPVGRGGSLFLREGAYALVLIADTHHPAVPSGPALRQHFHLTPAEVELTTHLLAGREPSELAGLLHKSPHTVRNQLKRLYPKVGANSRAQFVRIVLNSLAMWSPDAP